jgi:hypothetical protein
MSTQHVARSTIATAFYSPHTNAGEGAGMIEANQ